MKSIAAIVDNTNLSQNIYYMTKTFNKMRDISPFCYYIDLSTQALKCNFSTLNCYYANHYSGGPLIATSLETLNVLINLNIRAPKFFYCWDLEWLRNSKFSYSDNMGSFTNEYISIIARSESHAKCIENYSNKKVSHIIENWEYDKIRGLCDGNLFGNDQGLCGRAVID